MKAMILAAGRGERMRPLSDVTPKPLMKVGEQSLIERHIATLAASGVSQVIINVCYQAKKIIDLLGNGEKLGVEIIYSYEENGPYGTGGGIFNVLPILGAEPFILLSGDIWTDFPLTQLPKKLDGEAHLVMVENPSYHPAGDFSIDEAGRVSLVGSKFTYASIAVINPEIFSMRQAGCYPLACILKEAIERGKVTGELYSGTWYNVGTPQQLQQLQGAWSSK